MSNDTMRTATLFAVGTAFFSGFNTFLAKFAVKASNDAIVYTTLKNGIVALLFIALLLVLHKRHEIQNLSRRQIIKLITIGIIGGCIPFALFFTGLTMTSAINAALIHKTLFIWVIIMGYPILKERLTRMQWLGVFALFAANLFIGGFKGFSFNTGELMILAATILWATENILAKKTLAEVSSTVVATARMGIGSLGLLVIVFVQGNQAQLLTATPLQWSWTLLTAVLLMGYVVTWYNALAIAPASYVATILVSATLITNILSAIFITHQLATTTILQSLLYTAGIALIISFKTQPQLNLKQVL